MTDIEKYEKLEMKKGELEEELQPFYKESKRLYNQCKDKEAEVLMNGSVAKMVEKAGLRNTEKNNDAAVRILTSEIRAKIISLSEKYYDQKREKHLIEIELNKWVVGEAAVL